LVTTAFAVVKVELNALASADPEALFTKVPILNAYAVFKDNDAVGMNVALLPEQATEPATVFVGVETGASVTLPVFTDAQSSTSEKLAETVVVPVMPVALLTGVTLAIVSGTTTFEQVTVMLVTLAALIKPVALASTHC